MSNHIYKIFFIESKISDEIKFNINLPNDPEPIILLACKLVYVETTFPVFF